MPSPEEVERNKEIVDKYVTGRSQRLLAEEYGVGQQRISQIIAAWRESITDEERRDQVQRSFEMLNELRRQAYDMAQNAAAPVAVGKDGKILIDPVTNEVVRDYSGKLRAAETAEKMDESIRRLLGANAASKTSSETTVRFEITGVDTDDLT